MILILLAIGLYSLKLMKRFDTQSFAVYDKSLTLSPPNSPILLVGGPPVSPRLR
jgi:hypothetical protein